MIIVIIITGNVHSHNVMSHQRVSQSLTLSMKNLFPFLLDSRYILCACANNGLLVFFTLTDNVQRGLLRFRFNFFSFCVCVSCPYEMQCVLEKDFFMIFYDLLLIQVSFPHQFWHCALECHHSSSVPSYKQSS